MFVIYNFTYLHGVFRPLLQYVASSSLHRLWMTGAWWCNSSEMVKRTASFIWDSLKTFKKTWERLKELELFRKDLKIWYLHTINGLPLSAFACTRYCRSTLLEKKSLTLRLYSQGIFSTCQNGHLVKCKYFVLTSWWAAFIFYCWCDWSPHSI